MKEKIIINEPYIKNENGKTKLISKIELPNQNIDFFYEVDNKYEQYLTTERADSFLLMTLEYAMTKSLDIECKAPVTEQLYYQLKTYFIPILTKNRKLYNDINIIAETADEIIPIKINGKYAGGTGFSGGVDSFYSVLSCLNNNTGDHKLTHLIFANNGSLSPHFDYNESVKFFDQKYNELLEASKELKLELIGINTNMLELYYSLKNVQAINAGAIKTLSMVYALKKLFHYYWFSNSFDLVDFHFSELDDAYYDLFTLNMLSISGLVFYSSGSEMPNRVEKMNYIADNEIVQKYLTICSSNNCGHCNKCLRTLADLYVIDKLDKFANVFDIENYKKHFKYNMAKYFSRKKEFKMGFAQEIIKGWKKNKGKIPIFLIIIGVMSRPYLYLKKIIKNNF